jgi:hypothetical protein
MEMFRLSSEDEQDVEMPENYERHLDEMPIGFVKIFSMDGEELAKEDYLELE